MTFSVGTYNKSVVSITDTNPGCYGSAIFYRIDAPECTACPVYASCKPLVRARFNPVQSLVTRLDQIFLSESAQDVEKWFADRMHQKVQSKRSSASADGLVTDWKAQGLNVHHMTHGRNPSSAPGTILFDTFAFIIETKVFKPADVVEHLRLTCSVPKSKLLPVIKTVCEALLSTGVLKKEKHVLCLA